jgi:predicted enzyme related to lactoylglutathione lyase
MPLYPIPDIITDMPNIEKHAPGSFCWIELATTDQNAAKQFYTSLMGWTVTDFPMGPDGVYSMFSINGRNTGAAYTLNAEQQAQHVPPNWLLYVATDNADDAVDRASRAGGKVIAPAFDVMSFGRIRPALYSPCGRLKSMAARALPVLTARSAGQTS